MLTVSVPDGYNGIAGLLMKGHIYGREYNVLQISNYQEYIHMTSPCGAYVDWDFGRTEFKGNLDFSQARSIVGLDATFG